MIELSYRGAIPKYIQVRDSLIELLDNKAFMPGEMLPPVRQFASRLAVNPRILQLAYDELAQDGYIYLEESNYYVARKEENND